MKFRISVQSLQIGLCIAGGMLSSLQLVHAAEINLGRTSYNVQVAGGEQRKSPEVKALESVALKAFATNGDSLNATSMVSDSKALEGAANPDNAYIAYQRTAKEQKPYIFDHRVPVIHQKIVGYHLAPTIVTRITYENSAQ